MIENSLCHITIYYFSFHESDLWCPSRIHIRTTTVHFLYINDIANVSNIFKINLFADDTSVFHTHEHFEYLIKETNQ